MSGSSSLPSSKPEDKIGAQLLFDLGNVSFLMKLYSDALEDYKKAREFGLRDNPVDARINKLNANHLLLLIKFYHLHQIIGPVSSVAQYCYY